MLILYKPTWPTEQVEFVPIREERVISNRSIFLFFVIWKVSVSRIYTNTQFQHQKSPNNLVNLFPFFADRHTNELRQVESTLCVIRVHYRDNFLWQAWSSSQLSHGWYYQSKTENRRHNLCCGEKSHTQTWFRCAWSTLRWYLCRPVLVTCISSICRSLVLLKLCCPFSTRYFVK